MRNSPLVSQDCANRVTEDAYRLYVGRGKRFDTKPFADAIGFSDSIVYKWGSGESTPGLSALLSSMLVLGPGFATAILRPANLIAAPDTPAALAPQSLLTDAIGFCGVLAKALEDRRLDRMEREALKPIAQALIEQLQPLARGAE